VQDSNGEANLAITGKVKKGAKLGQKGPKKSINRGRQLIFTIAIWKLTKNKKTPSSKR
jgi:hypothetical protein